MEHRSRRVEGSDLAGFVVQARLAVAYTSMSRRDNGPPALAVHVAAPQHPGVAGHALRTTHCMQHSLGPSTRETRMLFGYERVADLPPLLHYHLLPLHPYLLPKVPPGSTAHAQPL